VMASIEDHAYSNLTAEVGGMLMGTVAKGKTEIVGAIPALAASAEQVTLTFTHAVWEEILSLAATEYPDHSIVGWYHTHPTFGIFLSEYDLFIQENFFGAPGHLALVIDPVQGLYGWFGKNPAGVVEVFEEAQTTLGPRRSVEPVSAVSASPRKLGLKIAVAGVGGLLFGGAIGAGLVLGQTPPDLSSTLQAVRSELEMTQAVLEAERNIASEALAKPVLQYVVQPGDSVDSVAADFYRDKPDGRALIMASNGLRRFESLSAGQILLIPGPTVVGVTVVPYEDTVLNLPEYRGFPWYAEDPEPEAEKETETGFESGELSEIEEG